MSKKYCIILIHEFPYFNGETFFDNELKHLSAKFDNIFIFSILGNCKIKYNRDIPHNVVIIPLGIRNTILSNSFKGLFSKKVGKEITRPKGLKYKMYSLYTRGKFEKAYSRIKKWITDNKLFLGKGDILIYTYWLNLCYIGVMVRRIVENMSDKVKLISRAHRYDIYSESFSVSSLPYQFESVVNADYIYPCSNNGSEYLRRKFPNFDFKIKTKYLGVQQEKRMLAHDRYVFATCCGIRPIKQIDLFAESFCRFVKVAPNYKWVCIGEGEDFQKVYSIVKNYNCLGSVVFTKELTNEGVIDCLIRHNVGFFFNVSKHEGLPVSLMEAQSLGIPCIATDVGGSSEIVNNLNGMLINPLVNADNLCMYFHTIDKMTKERYQELSNNSYLTWAKKFDASKNYLEWSNLLLSLL